MTGGVPEAETREMPDTDAPAAPRGALGEQLRAFLTGVMFLTRLPCPAWVGHDAEFLARSTPYFPLIGAAIGLFGGGALWLSGLLWPTAIAVVLSTIATVWLTGAFHEDALADACDGFGGGWSTEQILAIMKDSRVGSYGVLGLGLVLLGKLAALHTLASADVRHAVAALVAGHTLGRFSSLPLIWWLPYVREKSATGKPFAASVTPARLVGGALLTLGILLLALGATRAVPLVLGVTLAVTWLGGRYFRRWIGGITGDCLGAANQVVELAVHLALVALAR